MKVKNKEEIVEILMDYFESVYCDSCEHDDSGRCDECHRKAMNWGISEDYAKKIAEEILK
jgi:hypothetical protein